MKRAAKYKRFSSTNAIANANGARQWQNVSSQSPDFRIMSYNILAQTLLSANAFLYKKCSPKWLAWRHRKLALTNVLSKYEADLICLQEVEAPFLECSPSGYSVYYKKRTGTAVDGCAILVKDACFKVLQHEYVEYSTPEQDNRQNVAIVLLLEHIETRQRIVLSNTHLLWNPKRADIKLSQLLRLFGIIGDLIRRQESPIPILMCGDFNLTPKSQLHEFIITGSLKDPLHHGLGSGQVDTASSTSLSEINPTHPFKVRSVYAPYNEPHEFCSTSSDKPKWVDYIIYGGLDQDILNPIKYLLPPLPHQLRVLPNAIEPSDHIPILAEFAFSKL